MDIIKHITILSNAINTRNSKKFKNEFIIPFANMPPSSSQDPRPLLQQMQENIRKTNIPMLCSNKFSDSNLSTSISSRLDVIIALLANDSPRAYRHMLIVYNNALDFFVGKGDDQDDTSWFIPVLIQVSNDLRIIATMADNSLSDSEFSMLRESLQSLQRGWTIIAKDRTPVTNPLSKKLALFAVTNVLFKIYFSLNTLALCGKLINVIEGPSSVGVMNNITLFPVSDVVMYKYYNGRLKMFEDKYEEARDCLRFALKYTPCTTDCYKNRQRILISLIPVELCLGILPQGLIQTKYGLTELVQLGYACKVGDLYTYEYIIHTHQKSFIKMGIYLVLEQLKTIVYRSLFKRVYMVMNSTRLNLNTFEIILKWLSSGSNNSSSNSSNAFIGEEVNISLDEIECILANLIYQGKVKGYLSHQKRFLVLSKTDPFPSCAIIKKYTGSSTIKE